MRVGARKALTQLLPGLIGLEAHVAELPPAGFRLDGIPLHAAADEEEDDILPAAQATRRVENRVELVRISHVS